MTWWSAAEAEAAAAADRPLLLNVDDVGRGWGNEVELGGCILLPCGPTSEAMTPLDVFPATATVTVCGGGGTES